MNDPDEHFKTLFIHTLVLPLDFFSYWSGNVYPLLLSSTPPPVYLELTSMSCTLKTA